ncbi:hypothetical protein VTI28DRAFT_3777 [Corynascus sepedonium]
MRDHQTAYFGNCGSDLRTRPVAVADPCHRVRSRLAVRAVSRQRGRCRDLKSTRLADLEDSVCRQSHHDVSATCHDLIPAFNCSCQRLIEAQPSHMHVDHRNLASQDATLARVAAAVSKLTWSFSPLFFNWPNLFARISLSNSLSLPLSCQLTQTWKRTLRQS